MTGSDPTGEEIVSDFDRILHAFVWRAIPRCPGRFVLVGGPCKKPPREIVGDLNARKEVKLEELPPGVARDPVLVIRLDGGGLISYRKSDERFVHTLNTPEGFARKLKDLLA